MDWVRIQKEMEENKALHIGGVSNRYKVEWAHQLCHPETCSHRGDYRVYDNESKCYVAYNDDEDYLKKLYDC
tara:strand:+ start:339 stop:554 length:216 start_codon:yes stop_codon:yes gene_type:complete